MANVGAESVLPSEPGSVVVSAADKSYVAFGQVVHALRNVSFAVGPGEIVSVIGTNGSGKSTLLQVIAGLIRLDSGTVSIGGKELSLLAYRELARVRGILYQQPLRNLCSGFTVKEMISTYGDGLGDLSFEDLFGTLEGLGLTHGRTISTLSGGQQQMLALELVLARRPQVILLDEPTASLDLQNAALVRRRVRDAASAGLTVVFVSHNVEEALAVADHLLFLHEGTLVKSWQGEDLSSLDEHALREFAHGLVEVTSASRLLAGATPGELT